MSIKFPKLSSLLKPQPKPISPPKPQPRPDAQFKDGFEKQLQRTTKIVSDEAVRPGLPSESGMVKFMADVPEGEGGLREKLEQGIEGSIKEPVKFKADLPDDARCIDPEILEQGLKEPVKFKADLPEDGGILKELGKEHQILKVRMDLPDDGVLRGEAKPGGFDPGQLVKVKMDLPEEGGLRGEAKPGGFDPGQLIKVKMDLPE